MFAKFWMIHSFVGSAIVSFHGKSWNEMACCYLCLSYRSLSFACETANVSDCYYRQCETAFHFYWTDPCLCPRLI